VPRIQNTITEHNVGVSSKFNLIIPTSKEVQSPIVSSLLIECACTIFSICSVIPRLRREHVIGSIGTLSQAHFIAGENAPTITVKGTSELIFEENVILIIIIAITSGHIVALGGIEIVVIDIG